MEHTIELTTEGRDEDRNAILNPLIAFNRAHAADPSMQMLGLLLKSAGGETIGGLWSRSAYDWLFVELLFVPEELRGNGIGSRLMRQAEQIARQRALTGVWLDTFTFQARPFYEKLGYTVFAELEDRPRGVSQFWLKKRL